MNEQSPKGSSRRPQWSSEDASAPVVGRVVKMSGETAEGLRSAPSRTPETAADSEAEPMGRLGRNKIVILVIIFAAAGILGLPMLLLSPAFSKLEKVLWTVVILIYTAGIFYILALVVMWFYRTVSPLL